MLNVATQREKYQTIFCKTPNDILAMRVWDTFQIVFKICKSIIKIYYQDMHQLSKVKICIGAWKATECQSQANVIQK